jgi:hypothetical protein
VHSFGVFAADLRHPDEEPWSEDHRRYSSEDVLCLAIVGKGLGELFNRADQGELFLLKQIRASCFC